jgi:hypothetical protein
MALTPGLRIGIAAGALGFLGVVELLIGIFGSNHQPVLPGLVALALAVAVWQRSFVALVIGSIILTINAIAGSVTYGLPGFLLVLPFLAATMQALPVVRSLSKAATPTTSGEQDPPLS